MVSGGVPRFTVAVALASMAPGVASAQPVDPSVVTTVPPAARALLSFALIAVTGGAIRARYDGVADDAAEAILDRPAIAVLYGLIGFAILAFLGTYAGTVVARAPIGQATFLTLALAMLSVSFLVLVALGHLVVGTLLTNLSRGVSAFQGLLLGAALSSVGWLFLSPAGAVVAWLLVAAFGIGGLTREWVHASRADIDYGG